MPRNPNSKPRPDAAAGALAAAGLLGLLLAGPAQGQSQMPPAKNRPAPIVASPAAAANAIIASGFSVAEDHRRAQMWAATARFVYADDPALTNLREDLELTIDDASLRTISRGLDEAVGTEKKQRPGKSHVLTFQGIFKQVQALKPTSLPLLAQAIQQRLEANQERMDDPARRQQLARLVAQLNQFAGVAATDVAAGTAAADLPTANDPGAEALNQAAAADAGPPSTENQSADLVPTSPAPPAAPVAATSSSLPMISLILSVLSLLGVLYLFLTRNRTAEPAGRPEPAPVPNRRKSAEPQLSTSQFQELQRMVQQEVAAQLQGARPPAIRPTQPGAANQKKPAPQPGAPTTPAPQTTPATQTAAPPATPPAAPIPPPPPGTEEPILAAPTVAPAPPAARHRIIYVNQQPLDGAFRRDNLADAPASYTIFEISVDEQQDPNSGTFVVTRNEGSHGGYIGSHHSILDPACTYSYPQGAVSRIITDAPGTVQKTPAGDWQIGQKARIHFA